jgi:putative sugar O-methyltransferase
MLSGDRKAKIEQIRRAVADMIAYRESARAAPVFRPSAFWQMTNRYLSYIRELSAEQLENIRCHIGMGFFIGNPWHQDFYTGFQAKNDSEAAEFPLIRKYSNYISDLPEQYWCSEPDTNDLVGAIGVKFKGRIVNSDIVKEQACIRNLYNLGLIDVTRDTDKVLLELGPGYGQLTFQLSRMLGDTCCFVCVDYPETLFWSATFLAVNTDPSRIFIWTGADGTTDLTALSKQYRFIMVPNFALASLGDSRVFDLVINQNSFQEMTEDQVDYYAKYFSRTTRGWLYSYNASKQFMNFELRRYVHEVLGEYFVGGPDDAHYRESGIDLENADNKRIFLGYSKALRSPPRRETRSNTAWISDKPVQI